MGPVQHASAESKPSTSQESTTLRHTRTVLTHNQIRLRLEELGAQIEKDYASVLDGDSLVVIGVLNGAVYFCCDLTREIKWINIQLGFMQLSSYGNARVSMGEVKMDSAPNMKVEARHVLVVEDVLDSGKTIRKIREVFEDLKPASLKIAVFADKRVTNEKVDYVGFQVSPKDFLIGYGMDSSGILRNLREVLAVE